MTNPFKHFNQNNQPFSSPPPIFEWNIFWNCPAQLIFYVMKEQSIRIQTSVLNALEKRVLIHLAERLPRWMTSDRLTIIGIFGAILVAAGYLLSNLHISWLWLSTAGFIVNWYGDSLDGTLARVRHTQRPIYGFYLDHCVDGVTTTIMCMGAGLSQMLHLGIAMTILVVYLLLSISVYINAHLKGEFKLTFIGLGPTEFRLIMMVVNTIFIYMVPLRDFSMPVFIFGKEVDLGAFDLVGIGIIAVLTAIYIHNFIVDIRGYAKVDPPKKWDGRLN